MEKEIGQARHIRSICHKGGQQIVLAAATIFNG